MLLWWNGRHNGLKIRRWKHCVGSSPTSSTKLNEGDGIIGKVKDITGQRFGRLVATERVGYKMRSGCKAVVWRCKCDCGNFVEVVGIDLRSGHTKSCGCIHSEQLANRNKEMAKENVWDITSREYGVGFTSKGEEFYFDKEDFDKIKDYYWMINGNGYVVTSNNKKHMHRLIMGIDGKDWTKIQVDHVRGEHTKNDNRKFNLRVVNSSQNGMNKKTLSNNTSGHTGVYWKKSRNKWSVVIQVNKKSKYIGMYKNFEDAKRARKDAEDKYYGEYSYDNSQNIKGVV